MRIPGRKRRSLKKGLPPGSVVYIGDHATSSADISIFRYGAAQFEEKSHGANAEGLDTPGGSVTWINIDGLSDTALIESIGTRFGLHRLVMEDIVNTDQRPKLEDYGDYVFVVANMLYLNREGVLKTEHVSFILGPRYVLSFQEKDDDTFDAIRERIRKPGSQLRKLGADYLLYALLDSIVDNYFVVLEHLGDRLEVLEDALLERAQPETLRVLNEFKRELVHLRKSVWPLREVLNAMQRHDSALIHEGTALYIRDVYDHTVQVMDTVDTFRDMLSGMMDIYLSSINNSMNAVIKVLTVITTIVMPLSLIASIYGMNFKNMPELNSRYGYPIVLSVMATIAISMIIFFRKKKWL